MCGYKLGVLRGILDDSGIAEEIVFGTPGNFTYYTGYRIGRRY